MSVNMRFRAALAVTVIAYASGCDPTQTPTSIGRTERSLGAPGGLRDLPATRIALPPAPRAFDTNDDSLEAELVRSGRLAFIALKLPISARVLENGGRRAALPASAARAALDTLSALGVEILSSYSNAGIVYVRVAKGLARSLRGSKVVDFIEPASESRSVEKPPPMSAHPAQPALVMSVGGSQVTPWNIAALQAPQAWAISRGANARVMIVGEGVRPHDDTPVLLSGSCAGYPNACTSPSLGGVAASGIIAARDNTIGVVGIAPDLPGSSVIWWRAIDDSSLIDLNLYYAALNNAQLLGSKAILVAFVHTNYLASEAVVVASAWSQGAVIVAPAGPGTLGPGTHAYPAELPNVLAVSGVLSDGSFASSVGSTAAGCGQLYGGGSSNHGPWVSLAAPFYAYTTFSYGGANYYYDTRAISGWCSTQFSAAHVLGIVALLQSRYPLWTNEQVVGRLRGTASQRYSPDAYVGYGIPNAFFAVSDPPPPPMTVTISGVSRVRPGETCHWIGGVGGPEPITYTWTVDGIAAGDGTNLLSYSSSLPQGTSFYIALVGVDGNGMFGGGGLTVTVDYNAPTCLEQ